MTEEFESGEYQYTDRDLSGGVDGAARTPCCFGEVESDPVSTESGRPGGEVWRCPDCGNEWKHPTETVLRDGPWSEYA